MARRAALFVTCLVDQLFPHVGEAAVTVLRRLGVDVEFPEAQTCCGQPAFNDGFWPEAREVARHFLRVFGPYETIVTPSGSCAAMVREFYPVLLNDEPHLAAHARQVGHRCYELSEYLVKVLGVEDVGASFPGRVTYHASCHGLRALHLVDEPIRLIRRVRGAEFVALPGVEECCGFGGVFSIKLPHISSAMLDAKLDAIAATGADAVVATDVSCLMHIGGGLSRRRMRAKPMHLAELLAHQV